MNCWESIPSLPTDRPSIGRNLTVTATPPLPRSPSPNDATQQFMNEQPVARTVDRSRGRRRGRLQRQGLRQVVNQESRILHVHGRRRRARNPRRPTRGAVRPSPLRGLRPARARGHRRRVHHRRDGRARGAHGEGRGDVPGPPQKAGVGNDGKVRRSGREYLLAPRGSDGDGAGDAEFSSPSRKARFRQNPRSHPKALVAQRVVYPSRGRWSRHRSRARCPRAAVTSGPPRRRPESDAGSRAG